MSFLQEQNNIRLAAQRLCAARGADDKEPPRMHGLKDQVVE